MSQAMVIGIAKDTILTILYIAGPIMMIALIVGFLISILQATTQVQEQTLTFVPKIICVFVSLLLLMPFFLSKLQGFAEEMFGNIANILR
ncbi:MAG: flagellar biosynthesis protein FliQ [Peptostreptococcales bacterium]